jgi:hypothetical protein
MACIMVYCPVHGFVLAVCGAACESLLCACCVRVLRVAVHCPKGHSYLELKVLAPGKYHYRLHSLLDKRSNTAAFRAVPCCAVFMRAGHFYLELKGLAPGKYHYKYIIDNTWAVDGLAPKVLDSQVSRHACLLAFACFCLLLLAFACFCLLLLAFACFCLLLLAFACFCLLLLAWKVGGTCAQYGGRGGGGCCHKK